MVNLTGKDFLVPARKCGECTACCQYLTIETEELVKLPNVNCQHLGETGGCGIYASRPKTCDQWYCAWRTMPNLGDEWRPDKIGAMVEFARENFPEPFTGKPGYRITILDREKLDTNMKLMAFVSTQITMGVPCIISYAGKSGEILAPALLNFALAPAVKEKNGEAIMEGIFKALEASEQQPKEIVKIEDGKLVSAQS